MADVDDVAARDHVPSRPPPHGDAAVEEATGVGEAETPATNRRPGAPRPARTTTPPAMSTVREHSGPFAIRRPPTSGRLQTKQAAPPHRCPRPLNRTHRRAASGDKSDTHDNDRRECREASGRRETQGAGPEEAARTNDHRREILLCRLKHVNRPVRSTVSGTGVRRGGTDTGPRAVGQRTAQSSARRLGYGRSPRRCAGRVASPRSADAARAAGGGSPSTGRRSSGRRRRRSWETP